MLTNQMHKWMKRVVNKKPLSITDMHEKRFCYQCSQLLSCIYIYFR